MKFLIAIVIVLFAAALLFLNLSIYEMRKLMVSYFKVMISAIYQQNFPSK